MGDSDSDTGVDLDGDDFDEDDFLTPFLQCLTAPLNRRHRAAFHDAVNTACIDELWVLWEALKVKVDSEWSALKSGATTLRQARSAVASLREAQSWPQKKKKKMGKELSARQRAALKFDGAEVHCKSEGVEGYYWGKVGDLPWWPVLRHGVEADVDVPGHAVVSFLLEPEMHLVREDRLVDLWKEGGRVAACPEREVKGSGEAGQAFREAMKCAERIGREMGRNRVNA